MVEERKYYSKFKYKKEESLLGYFFHLDTEDWREFFDDYFNKRAEYLLQIFKPSRGEDLYSYSLIIIEDVAVETKTSLTRAIDDLLSSYYSDKMFDLLEEVLNTVRYLELPIDTGILTEIIKNSSIENRVREVSAITLSVVFQNSLVAFWDSLDLEKDHFLIPSYIGFFKRINPIKGIQKLKILGVKPNDTFPFIAPVKAALCQILISPADFSEFAGLEDTLPNWAKDFIYQLTQDYIELHEFYKRLRRIKQRVFKSIHRLRKVRLYRSIFADMIMVDLVKEIGCFEDLGIDLDIEFAPWNQIFDRLLIGDDFDIIIGNSRVFEHKNAESPENTSLFYSWRDLIKYEGFGIIGKKDRNLKSYDNLLGEVSGFQVKTELITTEQQNKALKLLLKQLKNYTIVAANNTDYYLTLKALIQENGLDFKELDIRSKYDPYSGFLEFISNDKYSIYIGSANLNQKAVELGCVELINEKQNNFGAVQYNSIITKDLSHLPESQTELKELILKFFAAYTLGRTKVQDNKDVYLNQWFDIYNYQMRVNYPNDFDKFNISIEEFNQIVLDVIYYTPVLKGETGFQLKSLTAEENRRKKEI